MCEKARDGGDAEVVKKVDERASSAGRIVSTTAIDVLLKCERGQLS